jgi:hypothetical protein
MLRLVVLVVQFDSCIAISLPGSGHFCMLADTLLSVEVCLDDLGTSIWKLGPEKHIRVHSPIGARPALW